jgi:hypothetical protein
MADMVDMAYTQAEMKEQRDQYSVPSDGPKYPWGLAIRLEQDELDKLGIKELPNVDQEVHIIAVGVVTGVNSNRQTGEDPRTCVAIQITGLQLMVEAPDSAEQKETMANENREATQMAMGGNVLSNSYRSMK